MVRLVVSGWLIILNVECDFGGVVGTMVVTVVVVVVVAFLDVVVPDESSPSSESSIPGSPPPVGGTFIMTGVLAGARVGCCQARFWSSTSGRARRVGAGMDMIVRPTAGAGDGASGRAVPAISGVTIAGTGVLVFSCLMTGLGRAMTVVLFPDPVMYTVSLVTGSVSVCTVLFISSIIDAEKCHHICHSP